MKPRGESSAMRHCARVTRETLVQRIAAASSAVIDHIDSGVPIADLRSVLTAVRNAVETLCAVSAMTTTTTSCLRKPVRNERHVFGSHKAG
jgi:Fe-S cluster assembly ATPase SufC